MKWNWEQPDWPKFRYDADTLSALESRFLTSSGVMLGAYKHLDREEKKVLTVELMSDEAMKTSEIEGEFLNRESLQSSLRRQFGLQTDERRIPPAEQGIAEMSVQTYETWSEPLNHETLFNWHTLLLQGRSDLADIGRYRTSAEPMQVVSGPIGSRKVHFEGPPSSRISREMDCFVDWFNSTHPAGSRPLAALARAGITHIYFESIHPFEDGNGRIGRALSEKALSQSMGQPMLIAVARTIESERTRYYSALEQANKGMEITAWLLYFAETILAAQTYTTQCVDFLIAKTRFYDRLSGQLNPRQQKVLARMFAEGLDGFKGGLSANNYIHIAKTSASTATRDLQDLVAKGALSRTGERKHTRYRLHLEPH